MNNILVFSKTIEKHIKTVQQVLQILQNNDLCLQPSKCHFHKKKINYLRYIISHGYLEIDLIKVARIMEWPTPTKVKDVQFFLEFCNFYCRFIQDYLKIAKPLFELTQKEYSQDWIPAYKKVFQILKQIIYRISGTCYVRHQESLLHKMQCLQLHYRSSIIAGHT